MCGVKRSINEHCSVFFLKFNFSVLPQAIPARPVPFKDSSDLFFWKSPSLRLKQFLVHSNLPSTKTPLSISVLLDIPESYLTCFNFNLPPSRHRNRNEQTWYFDLRNPAPNKMIDGTEKSQILSELANARRDTTNLGLKNDNNFLKFIIKTIMRYQLKLVQALVVLFEKAGSVRLKTSHSFWFASVYIVPFW